VRAWKKAIMLGRNAEKVCRAGTAALAQAMGADFIMYGSIANVKNVFLVCAMIDSIVAYTAKMAGLKPLAKDHPIYKIFQDTG
jgi:tetrahydromethanopterin S-methyltransferase subunit H